MLWDSIANWDARGKAGVFPLMLVVLWRPVRPGMSGTGEGRERVEFGGYG